jgi:hypothetical protein
MALALISAAYFINPSRQSVFLYVYPTIVARQRLGKNVSATTNTRNNRIAVSYQRKVGDYFSPDPSNIF